VGSVTLLLQAWRGGDPQALDELMQLVYVELRRIAARHLRGERPGHTLRPTDLVSEAFVKLCAGAAPAATDRVHFFALAARAMRRILVDHARRRDADKRAAGARPITFDDGLVASERPAELIALDGALDELARVDERKARAIELHYFGGLTQLELAEVLGVHVNTVHRDLRLGEAWIHRHMSEGPG
jgi:RNA polymerase sigma factor (TIGR02999 family)